MKNFPNLHSDMFQIVSDNFWARIILYNIYIFKGLDVCLHMQRLISFLWTKRPRLVKYSENFNAWQRSVEVCGLDAKANQVFLLKTDLRDRGNKIAPFYSDVRARVKNWPQSNIFRGFFLVSRYGPKQKWRFVFMFYF